MVKWTNSRDLRKSIFLGVRLNQRESLIRTESVSLGSEEIQFPVATKKLPSAFFSKNHSNMKIGKLNGLPGGCFMTKQSGLNSCCLSNHVVELIIQIGHVSAHSEKVKRLCWRHFSPPTPSASPRPCTWLTRPDPRPQIELPET